MFLLFSKKMDQLTFLSAVEEGSFISRIPPYWLFLSFLTLSVSLVRGILVFWFAFLWWASYEEHFICLWTLVFFEVVSSLHPNFSGGCIFFSWNILPPVLCISWILTHNQMSKWWVNIFSQSVNSLFILVIISFEVQKLLVLMQSHLFIFSSLQVFKSHIKAYPSNVASCSSNTTHGNTNSSSRLGNQCTLF